MVRVGSRAEVWHGTADQTSGGLTKNDLVQSIDGHIKSKKKVATGKKNPWIMASACNRTPGSFELVRKGSPAYIKAMKQHNFWKDAIKKKPCKCNNNKNK